MSDNEPSSKIITKPVQLWWKEGQSLLDKDTVLAHRIISEILYQYYRQGSVQIRVIFAEHEVAALRAYGIGVDDVVLQEVTE